LGGIIVGLWWGSVADRVVVMGGGSTGTSIFYHLAASGLDVILVEKRCIGCGQTGYSSAIIRTQYSHDETRKMAVYSWRFLRDRFVREVGCDSPVFREIGVAYGIPRDQVDEAMRTVSKLVEDGVDVRIYDPIEFSNNIYPISGQDLEIVTWEPHGGYGDPHTLVTCFAKAGERLGGKIVFNRVTGLEVDGRRVNGVKLSNGDVIKAEYVVNAMNVWSNRILSKYGLELPLTPMREDVVVFHHRGHEPGPVWADLALGFYSRMEGPESTLVGGLMPEPVGQGEGLEPGYYDPIPHEVILSRGVASRRFTYLENSVARSAWYGYYDVSPDWMPILGEDPRVEGLIHAVGLSGHGFKLSPALGRVIADVVRSGRSSLINVNVYRLDRFEYTNIRSRFKYGILG